MSSSLSAAAKLVTFWAGSSSHNSTSRVLFFDIFKCFSGAGWPFLAGDRDISAATPWKKPCGSNSPLVGVVTGIKRSVSQRSHCIDRGAHLVEVSR